MTWRQRLLAAVLITAALLTLLIACANAANLLLVLATQRRQEALIKTALGASRLRLVGEFLKETVILFSAARAIWYTLASAVLAPVSPFTAPLAILRSIHRSAYPHPVP